MSVFKFQSRSTNLAVVGGFLALGGGLMAAGCGGTDFTILTNFCVAIAQADCSQAIVQACYGSTDASLDADTTSCVNARSEMKNCDPGDLQYHAAYADSCIAAHQQVYSQASLQASDLQTIQAACLPVFNNGGQTGTSCMSDTDCDAGDGFSCIVHEGTSGTCQTPFQVMGGEPCTNAAAQCVDGMGNTDTFFCSGGSCIADPGFNGACSAGVPCTPGFRCVSSACVAQLKDGVQCSADGDCVGGFCLTTSGVQGAGVCSSMYTFSITSASCDEFR